MCPGDVIPLNPIDKKIYWLYQTYSYAYTFTDWNIYGFLNKAYCPKVILAVASYKAS